jgi:hypothetical protein
MSAYETDDPVYQHSRREALVILVLWGISFAWTVPYCYFTGYQAPGSLQELQTTLGIPSWVFWGVAVPWVVCGVVSILLCLFFIRDDDLGHAEDEVLAASSGSPNAPSQN